MVKNITIDIKHITSIAIADSYDLDFSNKSINSAMPQINRSFDKTAMIDLNFVNIIPCIINCVKKSPTSQTPVILFYIFSNQIISNIYYLLSIFMINLLIKRIQL